MAQRGDFTVAEDDQLLLYAYDHNGLKHGLHRRNGLPDGYLIWADDKDELTRFTTFGVRVPSTVMGRNKLQHRLGKSHVLFERGTYRPGMSSSSASASPPAAAAVPQQQQQQKQQQQGF